jgi:excisionase family DNA binding protein
MKDALLERDAAELARSLARGGDTVSVTISRTAAEFVAPLVKARADGREVMVSCGLDEVTPAEAASMLGMSRPQVRKLMEKGLVPYRKVGSHHRIPADALRAWQRAEEARREEALGRLADFQNELGLVV